MTVEQWLEKVAYKKLLTLDDPMNVSFEDDRKEYDVWLSKFDDSYVGRASLIDEQVDIGLLTFLAEHEVTEELTHGVGFSPKEQKWYGWSHRAIYGFGVGSTCKKGDCHYTAGSPEDLIEDYVNFHAEGDKKFEARRRAECQILPDRSGIRILHEPVMVPIATNMAELQEALEKDTSDLPEIDIMGDGVEVVKCGRGEWTAKTLEDAKQMAIDFNEGVS